MSKFNTHGSFKKKTQKDSILEEISEGNLDKTRLGFEQKFDPNVFKYVSSESDTISPLESEETILVPKAPFTIFLAKDVISTAEKSDVTEKSVSSSPGSKQVAHFDDIAFQNQGNVLKNNPLGQFKQKLNQALTKTANYDGLKENDDKPLDKELFYSWQILKKDEHQEICLRINEAPTIEYLLRYKDVVDFPKCMLKLTWEFCECDPTCVGELMKDYNYDSDCKIFDLANLEKNNFEDSCNYLRTKIINSPDETLPGEENFILKKSLTSKLKIFKDLFHDSEPVMNCISQQLNPTCKQDFEKCLDEVIGQNQMIFYSPIFYQAREKRSLDLKSNILLKNLKPAYDINSQMIASKAIGMNSNLRLGIPLVSVILLLGFLICNFCTKSNIKICLIGISLTLIGYFSDYHINKRILFY